LKKFFTLSDPVVPGHHPRLLVETAVAQGADRDALLENVGITAASLEHPDARISYEQFNALERNAIRLTNDPALGLRWGRAVYLSQSGLVGVAAMSNANLRAAFQVTHMYSLQLTPGWEIDLRIEDGRGFLTFRETIERGDLRAFATEALLAGYHNLTLHALGRKPPVVRARLNYPRPAHYRLYAEFMSDVPYIFDQPVTEVEFDPSVLSEPLVTADPVTARVIGQMVAAEAARSAPVDGVAAQVRKILRAEGARRSLDEVARALQTSTRSLRRALRQMGTSYQDIADEMLRARAEERVRSGHAKVEQIAQELGFTDARSFRRAFKRWTGQSPNEFRRGPGHLP
jgi:AraC-like DNA-binding protein